MRTPMPVGEPSRHLASGTGMKVQVSAGASIFAPGTPRGRKSATWGPAGWAGSRGRAGAGGVGVAVPTADEQAVTKRQQKMATRMVPPPGGVAGDHRSLTAGQSTQKGR